MATAAMAFMGCTGNGTPNSTPVMMLARPEKTSVLAKSIEPPILRAIINGKRVPRSPSEPDSSARGASRRVRRLCFATACRCRRNAMACVVWLCLENVIFGTRVSQVKVILTGLWSSTLGYRWPVSLKSRRSDNHTAVICWSGQMSWHSGRHRHKQPHQHVSRRGR